MCGGVLVGVIGGSMEDGGKGLGSERCGCGARLERWEGRGERGGVPRLGRWVSEELGWGVEN